VAKLTGVSKSMLGQIERSEVNPTISTMWKISNGLKASFTSLMSRPETDMSRLNETMWKCKWIDSSVDGHLLSAVRKLLKVAIT
jgi:transcriptional regulator with XRE-family HTH domain